METPALDQMTAQELKAKLVESGLKLREYRQKATTAVDAVKTARDEWEAKPEVKALFDAQQQAVSVRDQAETNIRMMQTRLFELTGEKNPDPAYQIREVPTPEYDPEKLTQWLMGMFTSFFSINKLAVNTWLKEICEADGNMPPLGVQHRIPALVVNKPTPAIISAGLERLTPPKPAADPVLDELEAVGDRLKVLVQTSALEPEPVKVDLLSDIPF